MKRAVISIAAAGAALLTVGACGSGAASGGGDAVAAPPPSVGESTDITVPAAIRNLPLVTQNGRHTSLAAYQGRSVMIADFMTLCEDICPMTTANMMSIGRALAADGVGNDVALLEISMDPGRDSLHRMRAYRRLYAHAPSNVTLLRTNEKDTKKLWGYFHVFIKKIPENSPPDHDWLTGKPLTYDIQHSDDLVFLGPNGHERFVVDGGPDTQGALPPKKLLHVLSKQGRQDLYHPDAVADWTVPQGLQVFSWLTNRHLSEPAASSS